MWVFGYGSLMWKVDFPFSEKIVGYIKGYERKFYQYSTDHRGTPENPGRVVTLIPANKESRVYGIAYRIPDDEVDKVIEHLDFREKGGYERCPVMFYPKDQQAHQPFEMIIYLASHENPNYAGHADLDDIARTVVDSIGPSGPNIDYVCNLAKVMREVLPEAKDDHLFELEEKVLALLKEKGIRAGNQRAEA
ncbi:putative glutathione-specific gamma-glutamylcyclotransferase 2 [Anthonomus grandis grandis]|uniref:putative glutathione-specific gamma-glutamylcyclotransferase 2 n=1 Tax=Anthonomus grandis grandis TaxID=2921223 RepID=UPI00216558EC|nr:putative glutathione-specific gamma-glutamylcyclotransferase 2 [Anthonomus grandis grandis]